MPVQPLPILKFASRHGKPEPGRHHICGECVADAREWKGLSGLVIRYPKCPKGLDVTLRTGMPGSDPAIETKFGGSIAKTVHGARLWARSGGLRRVLETLATRML